MDTQLIAPLLVSVLIGFWIYRRARRSIGRQPVHAARLWIRIGILGALGGVFLAGSIANITLLGSLLGGMVGGIVLAFIGLRYTKFESTPEGNFYTPHAYIGLLVLAIFVARIAYRIMFLYAAPRSMGSPGNPFYQYQRSPLTLAVFGLLVGYYVVFNLGVLRSSRGGTLSISKPQV